MTTSSSIDEIETKEFCIKKSLFASATHFTEICFWFSTITLLTLSNLRKSSEETRKSAA